MYVTTSPHLAFVPVRPLFPRLSPSPSHPLLRCKRPQLPTASLQPSAAKLSPLLDFSSVTPSFRNLGVSPDNETILKGTTLATLPPSLLLTPSVARTNLRTSFPSDLHAFLDDLPDASVLALSLCYSLHHNDSTDPFSSVLPILPPSEQLHNLPLWTSDQIAHLQGSPAYQVAQAVSNGISDEFRQLLDQFQALSIDTSEWLSQSQYLWALAVIDARAIKVSTKLNLVLAPVLMLCHDAHPDLPSNVSVELDGGFFSEKKLVLRTTTDIPSSVPNPVSLRLPLPEDILTNADRLLERGHVCNTPEAHAIQLSFDITSLDRFFEDKVEVLENVGLESSVTFTFQGADVQAAKWNPPENLEAFLRLLCLNGGDAFLLEPVFRPNVWGFMQLHISPDNEQAVCDLLIGACEDALDAYSSQQSSQDVDDNDENEHVDVVRRRMANVLVSGEISVLKLVKAKYERAAESLDALEYYAERRLKELDLLRPLDESEIVDSDSPARMGRAFDDNYR